MAHVSKRSLNRIIHVSGSILVFVSIGYIATLLWSQRELLLSWRPDTADILILIFSVLSYAAAGTLLAKVWQELLLWSGEVNVKIGDVLRIYGGSQIAKYIPGNIAQLLGRHALGLQNGWSHTGLVLAGILEMTSLLFVASIVAILGLSLNAAATDLMSIPMIAVLIGCLILGIIAILYAGPHIVERRWPELATRLRQCSLTALWRTGFMHLIFFAISGVLFLLLGFVVFEESIIPSRWPGVVGLVALAWVAGIITPGAPSGIGVRESVLTLGISSIAPVGELLLLVTLFRFVTIFGDIVFFLVSKRLKTPNSSISSIDR